MARGIAYYYEGHRVLITDRRGVKYVCDCENCEYKGGSDRCKSCVFDEVRVLPISSGRLSFNLLRSFYQCVKIMQRYPSCLFFGCGAYVSFISGREKTYMKSSACLVLSLLKVSGDRFK